jgi:bacteriocin-like protein
MSDEKEIPSEEKEAPKQAPELSETELDNVTGGNVNSYLIIDGRPGPSTSKNTSIPIISPTNP